MKSINKIFLQYVLVLTVAFSAATFWIITNYNNLSDSYIKSNEKNKEIILEYSQSLISKIIKDDYIANDTIKVDDLSLLLIISEPYYFYGEDILIRKNKSYLLYTGKNTETLNKLVKLRQSYVSGADVETNKKVQLFFLASIVFIFIVFLIVYRNVLKVLNSNVRFLYDDIENDGNGERIKLRELFDVFVTLKKYQTISHQAERQSMVNDIMSQWQLEVKKIVHDLKNPLQRITMSITEIENVEKVRFAQDAINEINQNLKSIRSTDLNIEINPSAIDIHSFFERINHLFYDINIDLVNMIRNEFKFDEYSFQRICSNLIQNAIEAHAKNISFLFSETDQYCVLDIVNDGDEIKNKEKLFVPFATTKKNGSGLGLIIILQLVHMHKGRFYLKSSDHNETNFRLELPK